MRAKQRGRAVTADDLDAIIRSVELLRRTVPHLRAAGAHHAATYVARALKSAKGAQRHAERMIGRAP